MLFEFLVAVEEWRSRRKDLEECMSHGGYDAGYYCYQFEERVNDQEIIVAKLFDNAVCMAAMDTFILRGEDESNG
jgi:hypothetical protein